jgi:glyoxylase I family protein
LSTPPGTTKRGIHHLALRTRDVRRLEKFYAEVLGLAFRSRQEERSVWLSSDDTIVMIERAEEGEPEIPRGSMDLVAFAIEPSMRAHYKAQLAAHGLQIEGETQFTLYLRDPDGRRVGLSHFPDPAV